MNTNKCLDAMRQVDKMIRLLKEHGLDKEHGFSVVITATPIDPSEDECNFIISATNQIEES